MDQGYIYVILTREFLNNKQSVLKIGYTKNIITRFADYPKGSKLALAIFTDNVKDTEKRVLKKCKELFIQRKDIGLEYFEGITENILQNVVEVVGYKCELLATNEELNITGGNTIKIVDKNIIIHNFIEQHKQHFHKTIMKSNIIYDSFITWMHNSEDCKNAVISHTRFINGLNELFGIKSVVHRFHDGVAHALDFGNLIDEINDEQIDAKQRVSQFINTHINKQHGSFITLNMAKQAFIETPYFNGTPGILSLLKAEITNTLGSPCFQQKKIKKQNYRNVYMNLELNKSPVVNNNL